MRIRETFNARPPLVFRLATVSYSHKPRRRDYVGDVVVRATPPRAFVALPAPRTMDKDGNTLIKAKPRPGVSGINRVLVTGGAGFVGSHLIDFLMARGDHVMCLDNFFTGSKENIQHHIGKPNFEIVRHDVVEPILLECDQVYHLACPASPVHYKFNPVKTIKTNVIGTLNMLGLAKRVKARFLLTSTSEVYGDPLQHPQTEEYWGNVNPIGERSCYDEGKRCAETLAFDYKREHGLEIRVARIFNTYGPRMHPNDGRVVSNFIVQALQGKDITIYGDGRQTRSFCYVDDLIEGFIRFMDLPSADNGEPGFPGPINLGNPNEFTIRQLAELVIDISGSSSKLVFHPLPIDDPMQRKPDIERARKYLHDWRAKVELAEGITKTIKYFDKLLKEDD